MTRLNPDEVIILQALAADADGFVDYSHRLGVSLWAKGYRGHAIARSDFTSLVRLGYLHRVEIAPNSIIYPITFSGRAALRAHEQEAAKRHPYGGRWLDPTASVS